MELRLIFRKRRLAIHKKPSGQWVGRPDINPEIAAERIKQDALDKQADGFRDEEALENCEE